MANQNSGEGDGVRSVRSRTPASNRRPRATSAPDYYRYLHANGAHRTNGMSTRHRSTPSIHVSTTNEKPTPAVSKTAPANGKLPTSQTQLSNGKPLHQHQLQTNGSPPHQHHQNTDRSPLHNRNDINMQRGRPHLPSYEHRAHEHHGASNGIMQNGTAPYGMERFRKGLQRHNSSQTVHTNGNASGNASVVGCNSGARNGHVSTAANVTSTPSESRVSSNRSAQSCQCITCVDHGKLATKELKQQHNSAVRQQQRRQQHQQHQQRRQQHQQNLDNRGVPQQRIEHQPQPLEAQAEGDVAMTIDQAQGRLYEAVQQENLEKPEDGSFAYLENMICKSCHRRPATSVGFGQELRLYLMHRGQGLDVTITCPYCDYDLYYTPPPPPSPPSPPLPPPQPPQPPQLPPPPSPKKPAFELKLLENLYSGIMVCLSVISVVGQLMLYQCWMCIGKPILVAAVVFSLVGIVCVCVPVFSFVILPGCVCCTGVYYLVQGGCNLITTMLSGHLLSTRGSHL